jgi:hypothetical protein
VNPSEVHLGGSGSVRHTVADGIRIGRVFLDLVFDLSTNRFDVTGNVEGATNEVVEPELRRDADDVNREFLTHRTKLCRNLGGWSRFPKRVDARFFGIVGCRNGIKGSLRSRVVRN